MSQDPRARFNTQISTEAAEWLVEFRLDDIDATGRRDFATWIRTSPEHLRAYLEMAALWSQGGSLTAQGHLDSDTLIALARAEGNVVPLQRSPTRQSRSQRWLRALAAAAVLVLVGGATLGVYLFGRGEVYATTVGEQRILRLEDGSSVELNSRSRIRVRFSADRRNVELLEGEGLFHVAKDPRRPFIVRSESLRVRAVGTQFDINRKTTGTTVTVVEGRVALYRSATPEPGPPVSQQPRAGEDQQDQARPNNSKSPAPDTSVAVLQPAEPAPILLCAGEQLTVSAQTELAQPLQTSPATATAWTQGQLVLQSATLTEVAEDFNRYSARRLTVEDHGERALRLSGVFATDPEFLLRYLRARPDITVRESDTEIHIIRRD